MASADQAAALITRTKTLINNDLKRICKEEGVVQSGNKAQLQTRVIALINDAAAKRDSETIQRLRFRLHNRGEGPTSSNSPSTPVFPGHSSPTAVAGGYGNMPNGYGNPQHYSPYLQNHNPPTQTIFRDSPFYEVSDLIVSNITLEASPSHRQTVTKTLIVRSLYTEKMRADSSLKLLLFSCVEAPLNAYSQQDVAFPSQIEVKINGDEVKANYKGLKNKPGSTRPVDITEYVRKSPAEYRNTLQITYALTQKKYNLSIYLVKKHSVDSLAKRIKQRHVITKQTVLNEMRKKADDPDIVFGSTNMSLKDPISTMRISIPCRSMICSHNQCFDAESFLQLQEQAPTWQCPVCNKTVSYEGLAVDQYVQEILDAVPKGTDQVTIDPRGNWSYGDNSGKETPRTSNGVGFGGVGVGPSYDDSDDDLVEISDYRLSAIKSEAAPTPQSLARTPPLSSREASSAPRTGSKRTSEVIDLTLSDDDEPVRPAKKVAYNTPSSLPDPSRRYQVPSFGSSSASVRPHAPSHNSMPLSMRLDVPPSPHNHASYGNYRQPPPRSNYPGQGTSSYPTYLGSSP